MSLLRRAVVNLALVGVSLLACLGALELFFRVVLPASDYPQLAYVDDVLRYVAGQKGVYRIQDEIAAPFAINAQGWNAARPSYSTAKPDGATRVAIVGDSFVEAFQVATGESLAEQLEALPGKAKVEALRFGISGAPFSHYLWMVEHEVVRFRPDVVVLNLVHNDFDESWQDPGGRYGHAFQHLAVDGDRVTGWVAPRPYAGGTGDLLIRSATLRYLRFNHQISRATLMAALTGETPDRTARRPGGAGKGAGRDEELPWVDANVMLDRVLERPVLLAAAIDSMVAQAAALGRRHGFRLLLLMDGARNAIYEDRDSHALELNRLVAAAAARHGVDLLDLHPRFAEAWAHDRRRFDFIHDGHWNARGHAVAARAIREWLDR